MSTQTPKECPQLGTKRTHSSVERWATGISERKPYRPRRTRGKPRIWVEPVPGQCCPQIHSRSNVEPTPSLRDPGGVGGSTPCGSVYTSGHVWRAGASSRNGTGVEKRHGAGPHSCPYQQPHIIGVQFTGQGLVHNQDAERTAAAYLPFTGPSLMI